MNRGLGWGGGLAAGVAVLLGLGVVWWLGLWARGSVRLIWVKGLNEFVRTCTERLNNKDLN